MIASLTPVQLIPDSSVFVQRELGYAEDYREGVAAFTAKRAPRFTGR